ncbi:MAG: hypothetical protein IPL40_12870 [Proteobacteria bacterium]|nr:hypothetical protein [Pseudomonadota bacterium]
MIQVRGMRAGRPGRLRVAARGGLLSAVLAVAFVATPAAASRPARSTPARGNRRGAIHRVFPSVRLAQPGEAQDEAIAVRAGSRGLPAQITLFVPAALLGLERGPAGSPVRFEHGGVDRVGGSPGDHPRELLRDDWARGSLLRVWLEGQARPRARGEGARKTRHQRPATRDTEQQGIMSRYWRAVMIGVAPEPGAPLLHGHASEVAAEWSHRSAAVARAQHSVAAARRGGQDTELRGEIAALAAAREGLRAWAGLAARLVTEGISGPGVRLLTEAKATAPTRAEGLSGLFGYPASGAERLAPLFDPATARAFVAVFNDHGVVLPVGARTRINRALKQARQWGSRGKAAVAALSALKELRFED